MPDLRERPAIDAPDAIPAAGWRDLPVRGGLGLPDGTARLAELFHPGRTLVVFIRHCGCIFTGDTAVRVRRHAGDRPERVLFVSQATPAVLAPWRSAHWPEARLVSDEDLAIHRAFGLGRGGVAQMFSPIVWARGFRAMLRGHFIQVRPPQSDPWTLPGWFLVERGESPGHGGGTDVRVVWGHRATHPGDEPAALPPLGTEPAEQASAPRPATNAVS